MDAPSSAALVTAAAWVRSGLVVTDITRAWRTGVSIWDGVVRANSSTAATLKVGAKVTEAVMRLLGRSVQTIVGTRSMRRASTGATSTDTAC